MNWTDLSAAEVLEQLHALRADGRLAVSGFLDTHQFAELQELSAVHLDGGYPDAQRRRAGLGSVPTVQCWKLDVMSIADVTSARSLRQRLHRELSPDALGDIHWGEHAAVAALPDTPLGELLPGAQATSQWESPQPRLEQATSAGVRLDSVVASLFKVSRGEAQTAIEYNFVFLNFRCAAKRTTTVKSGDQLVFRTKGRVELVEIVVNPRSGRSILHFHRFPA